MLNNIFQFKLTLVCYVCFVYSKHPFRPRGDRGGPMLMSRRNQRRCRGGTKEGVAA